MTTIRSEISFVPRKRWAKRMAAQSFSEHKMADLTSSAARPIAQVPGINDPDPHHHRDPWRREVPCTEPAWGPVLCDKPPCPEAQPAPPPCDKPPCPEAQPAPPPCDKPPCPEARPAAPPCDKPPCSRPRSPCAGARPSRETPEHWRTRTQLEDAWNRHAQRLYEMGATTGWDWDKIINGNPNLKKPSGPIRPPVARDTRVRPAYLMV